MVVQCSVHILPATLDTVLFSKGPRFFVAAPLRKGEAKAFETGKTRKQEGEVLLALVVSQNLSQSPER